MPRHSCQSGALEFFMLSKVHFSPKQKLIWSHAKVAGRAAQADHPVDPTLTSSELRTLFTIPSVLAVHVLPGTKF